MIWHPLVWVFWLAAATGGVLYGMAALRSMDIAANWRPAAADARQLRLEQRAETATLLGRASLVCLAVAVGIGLMGIARVWHQVIPGAMCGTGVLQAMGSNGNRALMFWGLGLSILFTWRVLEQLDRSHPNAGLTSVGARILVAAAPFLVLAFGYTWPALMHVGSSAPVSCCAAVYDQVLISSPDAAPLHSRIHLSAWGGLSGGTALLVMMVFKHRHPDRHMGTAPFLAAIGWTVVSVAAVKQIWSSYYYQVLSHPCPWCLFLPDYHGAGFFIFGSLALVLLESLAIGVADATRRRSPPTDEAARRRIRLATRRIALAIVCFTLLTAGPAIAWRLRTGVWLDGSP